MGLYLGENSVSANIIHSIDESHGWFGKGIKYEGKMYEWNGTLDDTSYSEWTPSTTAGTILSAETSVATFVIPDRTQKTYYFMTRWAMDFAFLSGATLQKIPLRNYYIAFGLYYQYPGDASQYESGNYSSYSTGTTNIFTKPFLEYYNSSGTLANLASNSYGPAYGGSHTFGVNISGNQVTLNLNRPAVSAKCSNSYFATERASEIDTTNSTIKFRADVFSGPMDNYYTHQFRLLTDMINNNWDFE